MAKREEKNLDTDVIVYYSWLKRTHARGEILSPFSITFLYTALVGRIM